MKEIIVSIKKIAGGFLYIPQCEFSELLCALLDQRTLSPANIKVLSKHGYKIMYKIKEN